MEISDRDKVISYLEDEQSKFIYKKKAEYNETGDYSLIRDIVDRYLPELKGIQYHPGIKSEMLEKLKGKKIVVWGCGLNGREVMTLFISHQIPAECFVDSDRSKWGGIF